MQNRKFNFSDIHIIDEIPLPPKENIFEKMVYDFLEDCEKNPIYRKAIIQPEKEILVWWTGKRKKSVRASSNRHSHGFSSTIKSIVAYL